MPGLHLEISLLENVNKNEDNQCHETQFELKD